MTKITRRPLGLSIIASLFLISGIVTLILTLTAKSDIENPDAIDHIFQHLEWIIMLLIGFGLLKGKKWSWWLTTVSTGFVYLFGIYGLINIQSIVIENGLDEGQKINFIMESGAILFMQTMIMLYYFTRGVFGFFGMNYETLVQKIITVCIISGLLAVAVYQIGSHV